MNKLVFTIGLVIAVVSGLLANASATSNATALCALLPTGNYCMPNDPTWPLIATLIGVVLIALSFLKRSERRAKT